MAKAKKVAVPVAPLPPFMVELTLSKEEAETLLSITEKIAGHPGASRRRYTDAVRRALIGLNLSVSTSDISRISIISFSDEETKP